MFKLIDIVLKQLSNMIIKLILNLILQFNL